LTDTPMFLTNLWYVAGLSASLRPGAMRREMLCGEPVLLGRMQTGRIFAMRDICPHRAAPLSAGRIREQTVECPYHGWRFGPDGGCTHIPSTLQETDIEVSRIRVRSYPVREQDGLVWVYFAADPKSDAAPMLAPPIVPLGPGDGWSRRSSFPARWTTRWSA
jgi:phenylpropionate dioxygenase-like ring-hydroxylating dioxygenase large terminal subunit